MRRHTGSRADCVSHMCAIFDSNCDASTCAIPQIVRGRNQVTTIGELLHRFTHSYVKWDELQFYDLLISLNVRYFACKANWIIANTWAVSNFDQNIIFPHKIFLNIDICIRNKILRWMWINYLFYIFNW